MKSAEQLYELAEKVRTANLDQQREMFELAWEAFHDSKPKKNRGGKNLENSFVAKLDSEAFESAAKAFVPANASFNYGENPNAPHINCVGSATVSIISKSSDVASIVAREIYARTASLALLAACLYVHAAIAERAESERGRRG